MDFGEALQTMKNGFRVARSGWNGKNMWLKLVDVGYYSISAAVAPDGIEQLPWIGMKTTDDKFVPWLASQTDLLADDWEMVK